MIERYSRPQMKRIWSDENKYNKWLEVEITACDAWADRLIARKARPRIAYRAAQHMRVPLRLPAGRTRPRYKAMGLLDVLDLFTNFFQLRLHLDDQPRRLGVGGLGADGVGLAIHLLTQEIELTTHRFVTTQKFQ